MQINPVMKNFKSIIVVVLITLIGTATNVPAQTWLIGSNYSVQFSCNQASGIFKDIKANILFDEQNPDNAKFNVQVDAGSLNTGNALMNKHAKSDEWLDVGKYPTISFASKKILKNGTSYEVTGDLTLHGFAKEVSIPFTFKRTGSSASFTANFSVKRSDFNIGKPGGDVDENIKINLSVPVIKS
jgi:polyisoprenoid-binding protein YceI